MRGERSPSARGCWRFSLKGSSDNLNIVCHSPSFHLTRMSVMPLVLDRGTIPADFARSVEKRLPTNTRLSRTGLFNQPGRVIAATTGGHPIVTPRSVMRAPSDAVTRDARNHDLKENRRIASATKVNTIRVAENSCFSSNREEEHKGRNEVSRTGHARRRSYVVSSS